MEIFKTTLSVGFQVFYDKILDFGKGGPPKSYRERKKFIAEWKKQEASEAAAKGETSEAAAKGLPLVAGKLQESKAAAKPKGIAFDSLTFDNPLR